MFATLALLTKPATLVPPINWVYWSLTYEVAFYVLVAIGLFCRKPVFFLAMLLPLSYLKVSYQPSSFLGPLLFFADQYPLFALGFFAQGFKRTAFSLGLTALTAALCIYCTSWLMATVGGLTVVLLAWCWPGIKDLVWLRPLARVGDWSYGLYLIHVPIGCYLLIRYRSDFILTSTPLHISYDVAALGICIGASWLVHVTVEVPSQRLGQRLAANLKAGLARPA
jgi:peptidoglycan/LPS O-acetylase OafA/YrhL